jgi:hypothetical protein
MEGDMRNISLSDLENCAAVLDAISQGQGGVAGGAVREILFTRGVGAAGSLMDVRDAVQAVAKRWREKQPGEVFTPKLGATPELTKILKLVFEGNGYDLLTPLAINVALNIACLSLARTGGIAGEHEYGTEVAKRIYALVGVKHG